MKTVRCVFAAILCFYSAIVMCSCGGSTNIENEPQVTAAENETDNVVSSDIDEDDVSCIVLPDIDI